MNLTVVRAAELTCRIVDAAAGPPKLVVVLCHGYGASGDDLVGLAGELARRSSALRDNVRFVFPEAPLALANVPFEGRAWWNIDIGRWDRAMRTGDIDPIFDDVPDGIAAARRALMAAIDELSRAVPSGLQQMVLGGFSQGAMLATDVALRAEERPAGLAILSGALICRQQWAPLVGKRKGLPTVQTHGTKDPIIPFVVGEALSRFVSDGGLDARFVPFAGGHGIDGTALRALSDFLEQRLVEQR